MKPILPKGTRIDDAEKQQGWKGLKFRLALAARKYPIQLAVLIALAVAAYPIVLLVDAKNDLSNAVEAIQDSRVEVCTETNMRNSATKKSLNDAAAIDIENAPTQAAKEEVARRRDVTLALIDALAPIRNCEELR
jgi:hypothetical protein